MNPRDSSAPPRRFRVARLRPLGHPSVKYKKNSLYGSIQKWRRGRDLNPWNGDKPFTHFPGERLRPLSHLSACIASIAYNKLTERIIAYSIANVKIDQAPSLRLFWKKIRSNSAHSSFNIPDLTIHLWYILGSLRML